MSLIQSIKTIISKSHPALALSMLLLFTATSPSLFAKEDVELIGGRFDFGYVPYGTIIKHRATLINQSNSLVKITKVVPGCGCTQIPLKKKELTPGESLEVEILLETDKIRQGIFQKAPVFYTDSRETPKLTITLTGFNLKATEPQPPIKVKPNVISLKKSDANASGTIEIVNNTGRGIVPKLVEGGYSPYLKIEMPYHQINSGKMETMNVKLIAGSVSEDRMDESITFVFNDQKQTRFTIPVSISR
ncbi:MAG: DUF1573 domain-containing protein [bacterium]|nr:DUF1573 domain-containing protein [bacterium]